MNFAKINEELNKWLVEIYGSTKEAILYLKEHADKTNDIKNRIRELVPNIVSHLYKIYGFGEENTNTIHHWLAEISSNLRSFCYTRSKATKRTLSTRQIMNIFLEKYMDAGELASIESSLYKEYGYSKYDNVILYNKIYNALPSLINYIKSIPYNERPNIDKMKELL